MLSTCQSTEDAYCIREFNKLWEVEPPAHIHHLQDSTHSNTSVPQNTALMHEWHTCSNNGSSQQW